MNVRLKRAKELAGYAVQLTKDEGAAYHGHARCGLC